LKTEFIKKFQENYHLYSILLICFTGHYFNHHLFNEIIQSENFLSTTQRPEIKEVGTSLYDLSIITFDLINNRAIKYGDREKNNWVQYNYDTRIPKSKDFEADNSNSD